MAVVRDLDPQLHLHVERVDRLEEIRRRVRLTVSCMLPVRPQQERRQEHRYPFPYAMLVTPVDDRCNEIGEEPISIIGHHLSEQGFDFYSKEAIPHRFLVASFPVNQDHSTGILLQLNWCRFGHHGWYENGGKFHHVLPPIEPSESSW
jgi:hypothetical protein